MNIIRDIKFNITKEQVGRLFGYGKNKKLSRRISNKLDEYIGKTLSIIRPTILYTQKKIEKIEKGYLMLEDNITFKSARLSSTLKKCDRTTVFLATIGKEIDEKIQALMTQKKITEAYVFDAIGSAAVEGVVENFQRKFDTNAVAERETSTLRFSPGYCDWQVQEQKKLFSVLDNSIIGVDLSQSCLMTPRKSVSGVFGIGSIESISKSSNPCRLCNMKHCIARRSD